MIRILLLPLALGLALLLTVWSVQTPAPAPVDAPDTAFSAGRAMADIREIAQRPHPTGSEENARVRAYLLQRMTGLGLEVSTQEAALPEASVERLRDWGDEQAASRRLTNLIGVLPGQDRDLPALMLMAHHDTTWLSPGAADDSTGVAAILETVRAIQARGEVRRDIVVLFTDAEELGLDGARAFFETHPLADRIGMVINLEARGGGGLASMFETGPDNAQTIAAFVAATRGVEGGVASNSASIAIYEAMPNGTDYTLARDRGIPGLNLAFTGRADHYHTAESTPDALDQGSVQHIGAQALASADRLARADTLPGETVNSVYADLLGVTVLVLPMVSGWVALALTAVLMAFAGWRARRAGRLSVSGVGRGLADGLAMLTTGLVVASFMRGLSGGPVDSGLDYYVMMARLLWLEGGVTLGFAAIALALLAGGAIRRPWVAVAVAVMAVAATLLWTFDIVTVAAAVIAIGLWLLPRRGEPQVWGGWLGLTAVVFVIGCALQAVSPGAAVLVVWPLAVAAVALGVSAALDPRLDRIVGQIPPLVATAFAGAWLMVNWHGVALAVGMDLPGALGLFALMILMLVRPLAPVGEGARRGLAVTAVACLVIGAAVAGWARVAEPPSAAMPDFKAGVSATD
ncbi:M20/M25/M40 family metallo-hydrolase [Brevundimonas sp.]|uniref:M20/M25/M40 family metallo-hydrolase n=1 Tax=Brevundimonas sp. TaxID=1871086 RepID=UPI0035AE6239